MKLFNTFIALAAGQNLTEFSGMGSLVLVELIYASYQDYFSSKWLSINQVIKGVHHDIYRFYGVMGSLDCVTCFTFRFHSNESGRD